MTIHQNFGGKNVYCDDTYINNKTKSKYVFPVHYLCLGGGPRIIDSNTNTNTANTF